MQAVSLLPVRRPTQRRPSYRRTVQYVHELTNGLFDTLCLDLQTRRLWLLNVGSVFVFHEGTPILDSNVFFKPEAEVNVDQHILPYNV